MRWDKCKCGHRIVWDPDDYGDTVTCATCGTQYKIDADDRLVYWLAEILKEQKRHLTQAR